MPHLALTEKGIVTTGPGNCFPCYKSFSAIKVTTPDFELKKNKSFSVYGITMWSLYCLLPTVNMFFHFLSEHFLQFNSMIFSVSNQEIQCFLEFGSSSSYLAVKDPVLEKSMTPKKFLCQLGTCYCLKTRFWGPSFSSNPNHSQPATNA